MVATCAGSWLHPQSTGYARGDEERIRDAGAAAHVRREADRILSLCINTSLAVGRPDPRLDMFTEPGDPDVELDGLTADQAGAVCVHAVIQPR